MAGSPLTARFESVDEIANGAHLTSSSSAEVLLRTSHDSTSSTMVLGSELSPALRMRQTPPRSEERIQARMQDTEDV